ncbi:MAG: histidine phosphatase family protein [Lachnospiraceae bacterium]|nr:histidine phosphatase family protein [Lachnospiraceae bacterium]
MRIIFVRHGEPNYELDCLTETGRAQAEAVARRLKEEGIETIYASPLGRAMETATAVSKELGLPINVLDFMHEVTWGSTDGSTLYSDGHPWNSVDEMARQDINLNSPDWKETPFFKNNRVVENVEMIESELDKWLESLGYVREGFYYRHTIAEKEHRTIALFSHGGSSAAAMGHILNIPFPYMCALFHMEFTGINIIRFDRNEGRCTLPCLELANDGKHIRDGHYFRLANK